MSEQEILEEAIQKAIDGGWKTGKLGIKDLGDDFVAGEVHNLLYEYGRLQATIFNHDFAKALWGGRRTKMVETNPAEPQAPYSHYRKVISEGWKHHLQQMVIAEDPIEYLGDNL